MLLYLLSRLVDGVAGPTSGCVLCTGWSGVPAEGTFFRDTSEPGNTAPVALLSICKWDTWSLPLGGGGTLLISVVLWTSTSCSAIWLSDSFSIPGCCLCRCTCWWSCCCTTRGSIVVALATLPSTEVGIAVSGALKSMTRACGGVKPRGEVQSRGVGDGEISSG